MTVEELNALPVAEAESELATCCGSRRWTRGMVARRPFADVDEVLLAADEVWRTLGPDDWHEAFAHHPRIGESSAAVARPERAARWSAGEQSEVQRADEAVRRDLAEANAEYERRFGHIFLICASGRSAPEILAALRERMRNSPEEELRVAAEEQRKITRRRLAALLEGHVRTSPAPRGTES